MMKKILTLLLSFTLIFTSVLPTFAADNNSSNNNKPIYMALGDSLSAGCKIPEQIAGDLISIKPKQQAFEAFRTIAEGGSKSDKYYNPVYKKRMNHWNVNAVPYTYVSKFADYIDASSKSRNGVHPGLRAKDYCYILGLIDKSEYDNDKWGASNFKTCQLAQLKNSVKGYKSGIKTADVITVELGSNDVTSYFVNNLDQMLSFITKLMPSATGQEKQLLQSMKEDVKEAQSAKTTEGQCAGLIKMFDRLSQFREKSHTFIDLIDFFTQSTCKSMRDSRTYWNQLMKYIDKNKKDGAIVIATTLPNPVKGMETVLKEMDVQLFDLDVDLTAVAKILKIILQPFVDDHNRFVKKSACKYDYKIANINNVVLNSVVTNEEDKFDGVTLGEKVVYIVHPSHDEQDKIFKAIKKVYNKSIS